MGLGGGGWPLRVILAACALVALIGTVTPTHAAEPAQGQAVDCAVQPTAACNGAIFGRAFIDHEDDGVFQPDQPFFDVPLQGIAVRLMRDEGAPYREVVSDANGCYAFTGLAPGSYTMVTLPSPTSALTRLHDEPLQVTLTDGAREVSLRYVRLLVQPRSLYFPVVAR